MIRKISMLALGVALLSGISAGAQAKPMNFTLDKPHTQILFSVNHLGFSNSHGKFTDYSGKFTFDPDAPATSNVDVSINSKSLELNDAKWNEHVQSADFLDVAKFPAITFKSTKIDVTGKNTANITGDLTLHGVTKPVVLTTVFNKIGQHPMTGKKVAGFSATTAIKRSEFGIVTAIPNVADDVIITLEVEGPENDPAANE